MQLLTINDTILLNNVDITSNISNDYIIDNVIFCDVSGQLKIRIDHNKIEKLIFTIICYPKIFPIEYINPKMYFNDLLNTVLTSLDLNYTKLDNTHYQNDHYNITVHKTVDNCCLVIEERNS